MSDSQISVITSMMKKMSNGELSVAYDLIKGLSTVDCNGKDIKVMTKELSGVVKLAAKKRQAWFKATPLKELPAKTQ